MKTNMKLPIKELIATIRETPISHNYSNFKVSLPYVVNIQDCGKRMITISALGGIVIVANSDEEVESKVISAIKAFFFVSNKFGQGLRKELALLGWQLKATNFNYKAIPSSNVSFNKDVSVTKSKHAEVMNPQEPMLTPQMMGKGYSKTLTSSF